MIRATFDNDEIFESDEYAAIMNGFEDDFYDAGFTRTATLIGNAIYFEDNYGFRALRYYADEEAAAAAFNAYADREDD